MALTGLAAGTVALLASARTVDMPPAAVVAPPTRLHSELVRVRWDDRCVEPPEPVPASSLSGRDWRESYLDEIPGQTLRDLDARRAAWAGADLHGAFFIRCNFRGANLQGANMRGVSFWICDFAGADLADADLTGAAFDAATRWPVGFDPQTHGARPMQEAPGATTSKLLPRGRRCGRRLAMGRYAA
jgi:hypothetical protein